MDPHDLNQYRSVEELANVQAEIRGRIAELNTEYEGLPFPEEIRNEVAGLDTEDKEIERRCAELKVRAEMVERYASEPRRVERMEQDLGRYVGRPTLREQDIYDLRNYRDDPDDPERTTRSFRDGALR